MKLYAKIKRSSQYFDQNPKPAGEFGMPFDVVINPDSVHGNRDDFCVKGGPGGQYKLADVNLFMKRSDGVAVRIK
jgi:hypothetical protein